MEHLNENGLTMESQVIEIPNGRVIAITDESGATVVQTIQNSDHSVQICQDGSIVHTHLCSRNSLFEGGIDSHRFPSGSELVEIGGPDHISVFNGPTFDGELVLMERFGGIGIYSEADGSGIINIGQEIGGTEGIEINFTPNGDRTVRIGDLTIRDLSRDRSRIRSRTRNSSNHRVLRNQSRHRSRRRGRSGSRR